ncbi:MAG: lipid-A-disaccharide synthase [Flavobacteriaceae bacterium]
MKYYIIAGEASGDLHGARLIEALCKIDSSATIRCWGGALMENAGGVLVKNYRDLAFMGFWEVISNLPTILRNLRFCKKDILAFQPDAIIYIDYPGFNLRIAAWAKKYNFPNHFYISPQVWAWKANRVRKMKQHLTALYTILPFEKDYFLKNHQYAVYYVGHPLLDSIQKESVEAAVPLLYPADEKPVIALLPGSRKQEIQKMLPLFLNLVPHFPNHQFVLAGIPSLGNDYYNHLIGNTPCQLLIGQTYPLLKIATAALVTSGTATLETALFGVPQVVCYRTSAFSYWLAKQWVTLESISLVNLILEKKVVRELIQKECNPISIQEAMEEILTPRGRKLLLGHYKNLRQKLDQGGASKQTAQLIINSLS